MTLFAKAGRFQDDKGSSKLGPGDYDPCLPKSTGINAGACSLTFTAPKSTIPTEPPGDDEDDGDACSPQLSITVPDGNGKKRTLGRSVSCGRDSPQSPNKAPASRLMHMELQQQAKQLAWSERERGKVQAEAARLRERERALVKSETQARAEAAKAIAVRDALIKRAEAAEWKAGETTANAKLLEAAEARAAKLSSEVAAAGASAKEAAATSSSLTKQNEELSSTIFSLQQQVSELSGKESSTGAKLRQAEEREADLLQRLSDFKAADATLKEEMRAALAAASRSAAAAEGMSKKAEALHDELGAAQTERRTLEKLSCRLRAELEECRASLEKSKESSSVHESSVSELRDALQDAEKRLQEATAGGADTVCALSDLKGEIVAEREQRSTLEERLEESEKTVFRMTAQLAAAVENVKMLEDSLANSVANSEALQQRLGDALAESVEYADASIRCEERLRDTEADCAALWAEREEAKNQLSAEQTQKHAFEKQLCEKVKEVDRLRTSLRKTELRLASAASEGEQIEDELASVRDECNLAKEKLENVTEKHASAASEARVLKSALQDSREAAARLTTELDAANSRLAMADAEELRLAKQLSDSEDKRVVMERELMQAMERVGTSSDDFAQMEEKMTKMDLSCEALMASLKSVESQLVGAVARGARTQEELIETLARCTSMQEELSFTKDKLDEEAEQKKQLEERLAQSAAATEKMAEAAEKKNADRIAEIERLGKQIAEKEDECESHLRAVEKLQSRLNEAVSERCGLEKRLNSSRGANSREMDVLVDTISNLEAEVAAGEQLKQELDVSQAEVAVLTEELKDAREQIAASVADAVDASKKAEESEQERQRAEDMLQEATVEISRLTERVLVKEADLKARRESLADVIATRGAEGERGKHLEQAVHKKDVVCAELRDMLKSSMEAVNAAGARTQMLERSLKDSEVAAAKLKIAVEFREEKIKGATETVSEQAAKIDAANATISRQAAKIAEFESQSATMLHLVDDIEASVQLDNNSNAHLKKGLADIHGVSLELGQKLAAMVIERTEAVAKLEMANGALVASSAGMRALKRALEACEVRVRAVEEERDVCTRQRNALLEECKRLEAAGEEYSKKTGGLSAEELTEMQNLSERLRLQEMKSAEELQIARIKSAGELQIARNEAEKARAEVEELKGITEGLRRAQAEQENSLRETDIANRQTPQDLKTQNATLSSELALAIAVMEAVGLLPKDQVPAAADSAQDEGAVVPRRNRGLLSRMASGGNSMTPPRLRLMSRSNVASPENDGGGKKMTILGRFGRKTANDECDVSPRSRAHPPRLALQERLLMALESASTPKPMTPTTCGTEASSGFPASRNESTEEGLSSDEYALAAAFAPSYLSDERVQMEVKNILAAQAPSKLPHV